MIKVKNVSMGISLALAAISLAACSPETSADAAPSSDSTRPVIVVVNDAPVNDRPACGSCGVVSSVVAVTNPGTTTGVGGVLGAIVGGVAGNQIGGGDGKKLATAAGLIGGAVVGNKIEGSRNSNSYFEVTINMESGGQRVIMVPSMNGIGQGSAVVVNGNDISLR